MSSIEHFQYEFSIDEMKEVGFRSASDDHSRKTRKVFTDASCAQIENRPSAHSVCIENFVTFHFDSMNVR